MVRHPEPGDRLADRYVLRERLGVGGTAAVFRADDERLGRPVALKIYGAVDALSDVARRQHEARLLAGLRHPAIVTLFDAHLDAEPPYLVMELVEGGSLAERLRSGALPAAEARPIVAAAAGGLAAAHATGIVHRDVKPANILIPTVPDPAEARLVDFGIAYSLEGSRHTEAGSIVGSAVYLSPEQARGGAVTPASDVYSLGLVLIECLTGRVAFPGSAIEAIAARLSRPPALDAAELTEHAELLARMTAADPADRPEAAAVAAALAAPAPTRVLAAATHVPQEGAVDAERTTELLTAVSAPAPAAGRERPEHAVSRTRRNSVLTVAAAAVLLALGVFVGATVAGPPPAGDAPTDASSTDTSGRVAFERAPQGPTEPSGPAEDGPPNDAGPAGNGPGNGNGKGKDKKP